MGTRGAVGFVVGGKELLTYNHFDSYPSALGKNTLTWLQKQLVEVDGKVTVNPDVLAKLQELTPVDESENPTQEQLAKVGRKYWSNVDTGENWYAYLRNTQGQIDKIVESGFVIAGNEFPLDSLFCEWVYVIDVDEGYLDTYEGFQQTPPTDGRWVGKQEENFRGYYPVQRIQRLSFADALTIDVAEWVTQVDSEEDE